MGDEWAVHELRTTVDFAPTNRLVNWFTGGLNFQVEHHLFVVAQLLLRKCHEHTLVGYPGSLGSQNVVPLG